ncbi:MAG: sodium:calcium antiporter [Patescibacteria group bacterium]|nr:sodium:calcium antiporter [Patescibacteria group bacterium]
MQIALWSITFLVAIAVLLIGADIFTKNSEKLGKIFGIPQFIIGITIVSIGTSLPELLTSIIAIAKGEPEFVAANVIGSNVANILLFIGITTLILKKIDFKEKNIGHDLLILGGITATFILMILDAKLVMYEAVILLIGYAGYAAYKVISSLTWKEKVTEIIEEPEKFTWKIPTLIALGAVGVYFGAEYTVESIIKIAEITKINSTFLVFTAVALGTSLPELTVSIMTAIRGNFGISLGNIFGSNFFNTTLIFGIAGLVSDLPMSASMMKVGIPFLIVATYLFTTSAAHKKSFSLDEGILCLAIYGIFITQLFIYSH